MLIGFIFPLFSNHHPEIGQENSASIVNSKTGVLLICAKGVYPAIGNDKVAYNVRLCGFSRLDSGEVVATDGFELGAQYFGLRVAEAQGMQPHPEIGHAPAGVGTIGPLDDDWQGPSLGQIAVVADRDPPAKIVTGHRHRAAQVNSRTSCGGEDSLDVMGSGNPGDRSWSPRKRSSLIHVIKIEPSGQSRRRSPRIDRDDLEIAVILHFSQAVVRALTRVGTAEREFDIQPRFEIANAIAQRARADCDMI